MTRSIKSGGCHCGLVLFEAEIEDVIEVHECNCSICEKIGFQHVIVPKSRFKITMGKEQITTYTFNSGIAQHYFCKICGVKPFYIPRSNPDGYSLNLRCMDRSQFKKIVLVPLDGKNWEANAGKLAHLSADEK